MSGMLSNLGCPSTGCGIHLILPTIIPLLLIGNSVSPIFYVHVITVIFSLQFFFVHNILCRSIHLDSLLHWLCSFVHHSRRCELTLSVQHSHSRQKCHAFVHSFTSQPPPPHLPPPSSLSAILLCHTTRPPFILLPELLQLVLRTLVENKVVWPNFCLNRIPTVYT